MDINIKHLVGGVEGEAADCGLHLQDLQDLIGYSSLIPRITEKLRLQDGKSTDELAAELLMACNLANDVLAVASRLSGEIKVKLELEEGLAMILRAADYFKNQGEQKLTVDMKKAYVQVDELCVLYRRKENVAKALVEWVKKKYDLYITTHHLAKAVYTAENKF